MATHTENPGAADSRVLTVWSDIGCPWATLALHHLHAAADRRGVPLLIDHRAFPLELFNRQSTPKHIIDAEIVAIAAQQPQLGWRLWSAPESVYPVTTVPALAAVQAAKDPAVGGLAASDELDTALRRAFYAESRCISIEPVILEIAEECPNVDAAALAGALAQGRGLAEVHEQWQVSSGPEIQGSPHVFAPGFVAHNPGATYHWTGDPSDGGFPLLRAYDPQWTEQLLDALEPALR